MIGKYVGDTGWLDGCTYGCEYWLKEISDERFIVTKNDLGGTSTLLKEKFEIVEPLLVAAEKAVKESEK